MGEVCCSAQDWVAESGEAPFCRQHFAQITTLNGYGRCDVTKKLHSPMAESSHPMMSVPWNGILSSLKAERHTRSRVAYFPTSLCL